MSKYRIAIANAQIDLGYVHAPQNGINQKDLARRLPSRSSLPLRIEVDVLTLAEQSIDRPGALMDLQLRSPPYALVKGLDPAPQPLSP